MWSRTRKFMYVCFLWDFQLNVSSIITPRNLFSFTLSTSTPSIYIWTCVLVLQFPNNINLVLLMSYDNFISIKTTFLIYPFLKRWSSIAPSNSPQNKKYLYHLVLQFLILWWYHLYKAEITLDPVLTPGGCHKQCSSTKMNIPPT